MTTLFYISFATDEGFRGATVVEAMDEFDAIATTTVLGINPGGEAVIIELPQDLPPETRAQMLCYKDRLVSKEELMADGARRHGDLSPTEQATFEEAALVVAIRAILEVPRNVPQTRRKRGVPTHRGVRK